MKKMCLAIISIFWILILLTGCNSIRYATLDNDPKPMEEPNENEIIYLAEVFEPAIVVETFDDTQFEKGFIRESLLEIKDGVMKIKGSGTDVGNYIRYENNEGFSSVIVCWRETADRGHLILWADIPGFGTPTFFNNPGGTSAHIHLDSLGGETESLGHINGSNRSIWITQEARIEGDSIVLLRNGVPYFEYKMDKERLFNGFSIGRNDGGTGAVDWIAVR